MAATTGNINLSLTDDKKSDLFSKSASLYTVAFEGKTTAYWSNIYTDGALNNTTATIPLINSGKLYIIETNASFEAIKTKITKASQMPIWQTG